MKSLVDKGTRFFLVVFCIALVCIFVLTATISFGTKNYIHTAIEDLAPAQTVIILGAGVYSDQTLTPILKDRVDTAIAVYKLSRVSKILVSGDNSTLNYNEVIPVRAYLLETGIPPEDIFLDYAGFDTYDSMYRARTIFQIQSAVVVTQAFHLPRALYLAQALGMHAQGVPAQHGRGGVVNYLREVPANVKAILNLIFKSKPTYEGKVIPITGDGRATLGE